jgi:hypothetical protein
LPESQHLRLHDSRLVAPTLSHDRVHCAADFLHVTIVVKSTSPVVCPFNIGRIFGVILTLVVMSTVGDIIVRFVVGKLIETMLIFIGQLEYRVSINLKFCQC